MKPNELEWLPWLYVVAAIFLAPHWHWAAAGIILRILIEVLKAV